jgi:hypothetical protein
MSKWLRWIIFSFFSLLPGLLQAQEDSVPRDSIAFYEFLKSQKEIPGVGYRFIFPSEGITPDFPDDSQFSLSKTDTGFVTEFLSDFSWIDELQQQLASDSLTYQIQLGLYSQPRPVGSIQDYVSDLIGKGDYLIKTPENLSNEDFVSLAAQSPYLPAERFKLMFLSDYRLLAVTVIILFFFLSSAGLIISMLVMKAGKIKRETLANEYEGMIIEPLTNLLFEKGLKEIVVMDQAEIHAFFPKNLLAKDLYQHVLIDRIIGLNKKMKGEFKEKLKALYRKLELDKVSIQSLRHRKWDRVTRGLVQINEMDLIEALPEVRKLANSSNFQIRSRAVATLLNLSDRVDLTTLRDQTFPLSLWQQMNYLRIIRFVGLHKELDLAILLDSKNQSIRVFAIKLVRILGRLDMIDRLGRFEENASDEEKIEILETYATLGAHMGSRFVNDCLRSSNLALSAAAGKAASVIGDADTVEILLDLLEAETDFRRKRTFLRSLYKLDRQRFETFTLGSSNPDFLELRNHLLDPMLQDV